METQKVIVYIDGFNFYYGLRSDTRWKRYYWLDMVSLMEKFMRGNQELVEVNYFSAIINDLDKSRNQSAFFQANRENPKFKLTLGKYLSKTICCRNCGYSIKTYEEKETDVRIATRIVSDIYTKRCDASIIVSADSDMIPAIEIAKEVGHPTYIYFPPNHYSSNLAAISGGHPVLLSRYESRFRNSLLPDVVHLASGFDLTIPEKWAGFRI